MNYSEIMKWVTWLNTLQPWETKQPVMVNYVQVSTIIAVYESNSAFFKYNKISFHTFLLSEIEKVRNSLSVNPVVEPVDTTLREVHLMLWSSENDLKALYPDDLGIGWRSDRHGSIIRTLSVLHAYVKDKNVFGKFVTKVSEWYQAYRTVLEIKRDLNKYYTPAKDTTEDITESRKLEQSSTMLEAIRKKVVVFQEKKETPL